MIRNQMQNAEDRSDAQNAAELQTQTLNVQNVGTLEFQAPGEREGVRWRVVREGDRVRLLAPPEVRGLSRASMQDALMASLWMRAMDGDKNSAALYLAHRRWIDEMRKGRPVERSLSLVVVDDLRGPAPAHLPGDRVGQAIIDATPSLGQRVAAAIKPG